MTSIQRTWGQGKFHISTRLVVQDCQGGETLSGGGGGCAPSPNQALRILISARFQTLEGVHVLSGTVRRSLLELRNRLLHVVVFLLQMSSLV